MELYYFIMFICILAQAEVNSVVGQGGAHFAILFIITGIMAFQLWHIIIEI